MFGDLRSRNAFRHTEIRLGMKHISGVTESFLQGRLGEWVVKIKSCLFNISLQNCLTSTISLTSKKRGLWLLANSKLLFVPCSVAERVCLVAWRAKDENIPCN
jgi:hypothetical protein